MQRKLAQVAVRTSLLYGFIGSLWILLSDQVLVAIVSDPNTINRLQTYKGWTFVTVSALVLYTTLRRELHRWEQEVAGRREAEEAVRESARRFRFLVENAPDGIFIQTEGRFFYLNPAAVKLFGAQSLDDLIGKPILERVHPEYQESVRERIRVLNSERKDVPFVEEKFLKLDGSQVDVEVTALPFAYEGHNGSLVFCRDITERNQVNQEKAALAEQLQQAQKMEAIGTLAGGIAHDFNNILSAILGFAELASFDMDEAFKAKRNLEQSIKAAHRAKDLVQQILTFSRQGKQERKPLNLKPIVKEGLKFLRASLPATIEIHQEIEEDLGPIEADPTQIHQVLMNLCTNAAHAMDEKGGVLIVSLSNLDLDRGITAAQAGIEAGSYVRLQVSDTGHGMSPEILRRIFDPYFTTREPGKGTGLGLSVVHGIVKSYGGRIAVSSEAGKGSTFDIYFPRIETAGVPMEAYRAELLPLGSRERVLFVDDEKAIVDLSREILGHLGYEVVTRTSSIEALELFRARSDQFDLVITDMTMPNMTGDRLAKELLRIRPDIPIILCTGFSEHITEEKAKGIGIRELVMKPMTMRELATAMRRALNSTGSMKNLIHTNNNLSTEDNMT
jgi:PAS domain S-box-containing protein